MSIITWTDSDDCFYDDEGPGAFIRIFKGDTTVCLDGDFTKEELKEIIEKLESQEGGAFGWNVGYLRGFLPK